MNFLIFGEFWGGQLGGMASLGVDYVRGGKENLIGLLGIKGLLVST